MDSRMAFVALKSCLYALFSGFKAGSWTNIHYAVPDLSLNSLHCPETDGDN